MFSVRTGLFRRWLADRRGSVVTTFALAAPVIAVLALGAVDLASVSADKQKLQDVADAAALMAAKQLGMADNNGLAERTKAVMAEQLADVVSRLTYTAAVTPDTDEGLVQVQLIVNRNSFFANMLPPGGWNFTITANAQQMATTPLCVLSFGDDKSDVINLKDTARLQAPGCLVHSNSDVRVEGSAFLSAGTVQAAGISSGNVSPAAQTDAPSISDPFSSLPVKPEGAFCTPIDVVKDFDTYELAPGVHCGNITAQKLASIILLPGEHYFQKGKLELKEDAKLVGDNVVLIFGKDAKFDFKDKSQITLRGRRQGTYAGFVIATSRDNTNTFEISSEAARELLGTVYVPNARLLVMGKNKKRIADQSAWTVIVAQAIELKENPDLVINKNYAGSPVPVPSGVGPNGSVVRLTQ